MKYRIPLAAAAVTAVLLATAFAWADGSSGSTSGSTSSTSSTSTTSTTPTATSQASPIVPSPTVTTQTTAVPPAPRASSIESIPDGTSRTFVVENAGTVLVGRNGASLQIIAATPNAGWASEVEVASGREVEGDFRSGVLRVKYNFELEDGAVRVRIEAGDDSRDGDDDNRRGEDDDDRSGGDDDDNSGPGSGDGDDDNSGSGHDDDDADDDNSGPGSGDSDDDD